MTAFRSRTAFAGLPRTGVSDSAAARAPAAGADRLSLAAASPAVLADSLPPPLLQPDRATRLIAPTRARRGRVRFMVVGRPEARDGSRPPRARRHRAGCGVAQWPRERRETRGGGRRRWSRRADRRTRPGRRRAVGAAARGLARPGREAPPRPSG